MQLGKTASIGGLLAFGTTTSLFAKIGVWMGSASGASPPYITCFVQPNDPFVVQSTSCNPWVAMGRPNIFANHGL